MKFKTIAVLALAGLVLTTGVAVASPGNAPVETGADESTPGADAGPADRGQPDHAGENESDAENAANESDSQGPPVDLPEQVPDHVSQIHDQIRQFLDGSLDGSLGEAISSILESTSPAPDTPANASG